MNSFVLEKLRAWQASPLLFVTEAISVTPSSQQAEALSTFIQHKRHTIRSGHGTGKDAFASWIVLWFLTCFPYPKIMCTAPTARQLNDILWAELSKWTRQSVLADEFVIQSDKIFHKDAPKEWWARAVTASVKASAEDQAETLAGLHADNMLFVCDEASGIPDPVYIPLEGAMTQENNRVLLIGNMTRNTGYFYDSHYDPIQAKLWNRIHWDSRKSSNVHPDMIEYFRTKYGEDSNTFRIRVCGEPPLNDEMSLIPLHWAQQCVDNDMPEHEDDARIIGVDVARYGIDSSIILPRVGNIIKPWDEYKEMNTNILSQLCKEEFISFEADRIGIDEIGVGGPVLDWLQLNGLRGKAIGVNVANKSFQPEKFYRLRDELWWRVREKCMRAQYSFPSGKLGQTLCDELSSIRFDDGEDGKGIVKIESKKAMKVRNVMSPNIADALCISEFFFTPMAGRVTDRGKVSPPTKKLDRARVSTNSSRYGRYAYQVV